MIRRSHTAVVERNRVWSGTFQTEPYEAAWAGEAIFFVRTLEATGAVGGSQARVQISPDGMRWCDEGTEVELCADAGVAFAKVENFGGYLRLAGELFDGAEVRVIVYLALKT